MDIDKLRLMYGNSVKKYMGLYLLQNANNIGIICKNGIVRESQGKYRYCISTYNSNKET